MIYLCLILTTEEQWCGFLASGNSAACQDLPGWSSAIRGGNPQKPAKPRSNQPVLATVGIVGQPPRRLSDNTQPTASYLDLAVFCAVFRKIEPLFASKHRKNPLKPAGSRYGQHSRKDSWQPGA
jgi:hypothetical protein